MAAANRVNAVVGGRSLAVAGVRYNVPEPDEQDGATCWYYSARNMLKSWGLNGGAGGQALSRINPRAPEYVGRDRSDIFNQILRGAEFSFQKEQTVDFGRVCTWLNDGPFLISLTKHPKASQATLWDSAVLGSPLGEPAANVLVRIPYELQGDVPHMMLAVGYVKRKYRELRELMQSGTARGIADGVKKVISEITEQGGETCEVFLLDPNQPKMRPEHGPRNDVVLCDWFELSRGGNINYALRVNRRA
ncbi:uncharacterized protein LOC144633008 [Oculina patagonica]